MAPLPPSKPSLSSAPPAHATAASNPTGASTSPETSTTTTADINADTTMADTTPNPKKRKRKDAQKDKQQHILFQTTFRKTSWCYLHLVLVTPSALTTSSTSTASNSTAPTPDLSPIRTSILLSSALRSYLGTTGTAIPLDILKTSGRNVWVRLPRGDVRGVVAAVSGWVGSVEGAELFGSDNSDEGKVDVAWRVVGCKGSLGLLGAGEGDGDGDGRTLFG